MANTTAVYARIDTKLKENAEDILAQLGISPSSAMQMFYSKITDVLQQNRADARNALRAAPAVPQADGDRRHDARGA